MTNSRSHSSYGETRGCTAGEGASLAQQDESLLHGASNGAPDMVFHRNIARNARRR